MFESSVAPKHPQAHPGKLAGFELSIVLLTAGIF